MTNIRNGCHFIFNPQIKHEEQRYQVMIDLSVANVITKVAEEERAGGEMKMSELMPVMMVSVATSVRNDEPHLARHRCLHVTPTRKNSNSYAHVRLCVNTYT